MLILFPSFLLSSISPSYSPSSPFFIYIFTSLPSFLFPHLRIFLIFHLFFFLSASSYPSLRHSLSSSIIHLHSPTFSPPFLRVSLCHTPPPSCKETLDSLKEDELLLLIRKFPHSFKPTASEGRVKVSSSSSCLPMCLCLYVCGCACLRYVCVLVCLYLCYFFTCFV